MPTYTGLLSVNITLLFHIATKPLQNISVTHRLVLTPILNNLFY